MLTLADPSTEFEFFKLLVLCVIAEQPRIFISRLLNKDPQEMFKRAKGATQPQQPPIEFYKFYEWISNDIARSLYSKDAFFDRQQAPTAPPPKSAQHRRRSTKGKKQLKEQMATQNKESQSPSKSRLRVKDILRSLSLIGKSKKKE